MCEDYRANVRIDLEMDKADVEAGRKVQCALAVYWGEPSHTEKFFNPREPWPPCAANLVKLHSLPCGHYPAEQVPEHVFEGLAAFFTGI